MYEAPFGARLWFLQPVTPTPLRRSLLRTDSDLTRTALSIGSMAQSNTPALNTRAVPPAPLSPAELADVLAVSGSSQVRAAYACGLASALLPVLVIALQQPELELADRMAWLAATLLLAISLLCGLATFLEKSSLMAASAAQRIRNSIPFGRVTPRTFQTAPLSPREKRALATSVSSHCAATFAVLGAFVACAAWIIR